MTDTASRNPVGAPRFLADALLRTVSGGSAFLRVSPLTTDCTQAEIGIAPAPFASVEISPVAMRKLRPAFKDGEQPGWELLVSATSVAKQLRTFDAGSARE